MFHETKANGYYPLVSRYIDAGFPVISLSIFQNNQEEANECVRWLQQHGNQDYMVIDDRQAISFVFVRDVDMLAFKLANHDGNKCNLWQPTLPSQ